MKKVDTFAYFTMLREMTEQGEDVQVRVSGNSMLPFLAHQRDFIFFKKPDRPLKRGDIVAYQRENGQFIVHRIYKVRREGIYTVGDAQSQIEGPLPESCFFGLITRVQRKGTWIGPGNLCWEFFARIWIHMIPLRIPLMKLYSSLKGTRR